MHSMLNIGRAVFEGTSHDTPGDPIHQIQAVGLVDNSILGERVAERSNHSAKSCFI